MNAPLPNAQATATSPSSTPQEQLTRDLANAQNQLAEARDQLAETRTQLAQARTELAERKLIDQAKAVLMQQHAITEPEAYARLRKAAMDKGLKVAEVAQRLLDAAALLAHTTPQTGTR